MDDRDPGLLAHFRADAIADEFANSEAEFTTAVQQEILRLNRRRSTRQRLLLAIGYVLFMAIVGFALFELSTVPLLDGTPDFVNNLTTPLGGFAIFAWIIARRVMGRA